MRKIAILLFTLCLSASAAPLVTPVTWQHVAEIEVRVGDTLSVLDGQPARMDLSHATDVWVIPSCQAVLDTCQVRIALDIEGAAVPWSIALDSIDGRPVWLQFGEDAAAPVSEPGMLGLVIAGLMGMGLVGRRRT